MQKFICKTCGVQYAPSDSPPAQCIICEDERQWVGWHGQEWTTLAGMAKTGYRNEVRILESGLSGICTVPRFAIGQRAILIQTPLGNVLWDCISYLDDVTIDKIRSMGPLLAIATSHPHFHGSMMEWSHAFGNTPVYVPGADKNWIVRPDRNIHFWDGSLKIAPGITLIQCGGHFDGSAVIHWADGAAGMGVLLVGDTIQVVPDRRYVSFMRSYPNLIPLPASAIRGIVAAVKPYHFDRIYGGWWGRDVTSEGAQCLERSVERYIKQLTG